MTALYWNFGISSVRPGWLGKKYFIIYSHGTRNFQIVYESASLIYTS